MKLYPTAIFAALATACVPAAADPVTITTGVAGGTYHNQLGNNLGNILAEQGIEVELVTSAGSIENLERIADGDADIGFSQADAYAHWSRNRVGDGIDILGSLGQECVFVATREDGISRDRDLGAEGVGIGVGDRGTGSAVTWQYLQSLNEDYRKASTYHRGGIRALAQVQTNQLDAFLWVTSPENKDHRFFQAVQASDSGMQLIDVDSRAIRRGKLPNGDDVYEMERVVIESGFFRDSTVRVPCTTTLVVASGDLEDRVLEEVATAIMMNANRIQGR